MVREEGVLFENKCDLVARLDIREVFDVNLLSTADHEVCEQDYRRYSC